MRKDTKVNTIMENGQLIANLYWRWLDERGREDINEYGKVISKQLGCPVKMQKRPFGFTADNKYKVTVTGGANAELAVVEI